jgi:hypothetical protein
MTPPASGPVAVQPASRRTGGPTGDPLATRLGQALHSGQAGLAALTDTSPRDRRDRVATLLTIYDLHTAPLGAVAEVVRWQGHPAVAEVKTRFESQWLAELEVAYAAADIPAVGLHTVDGAVAAIRAIAANGRLPAAYRWLAREATWPEVVNFLALEGGPDGGFDDRVALCQVGLAGSAKLELAQNFWDEMGNGTQPATGRCRRGVFRRRGLAERRTAVRSTRRSRRSCASTAAVSASTVTASAATFRPAGRSRPEPSVEGGGDPGVDQRPQLAVLPPAGHPQPHRLVPAQPLHRGHRLVVRGDA